jgi:hypothetical protein
MPVEVNQKEQMSPTHQVILRLCGHTRYTVPLNSFEEFVGEPYSFEKHLRHWYDSNTLNFNVPLKGELFDTGMYRKAFDQSNGIISDGASKYIAFYIGFKERPADQSVQMWVEATNNLHSLKTAHKAAKKGSKKAEK